MKTCAHVLIAIAVLALSGSPAEAQVHRAAAVAAAADMSAVLEATARLASPAVVEIFTTWHVPGEGVVARTGDLVTTERASGAGVIVDPDGFIVTNAHVVRGAERLRIELPASPKGASILGTRRRTVGGQIVGIDLETDLAVIKIEERNLPALTFGDSDELRAGQVVLALGSPLGLHNSVSLGVVSAVARQLQPESPMIYVQTDASINPGSSGGPLVDLRGRIVGLNTLILSHAGGHEGLGFAAPSNIVRTVYEQLRKNSRVRRGDIGVRPQTVSPALAAGLGLPRDEGVILADVLPGSPAARAGLQPGDLVLALDGKPMENGRQLQITLYRRFVGDAVLVEILRGTETLKVRVPIAERLDPLTGLPGSIDPRQNLVPRLGILALSLNRTIAEMLPGLRTHSGVVVASTVVGAIDARDGGLAPGDVICAVNRKQVAALGDLRVAIDQLKAGEAVVLQLERVGQLMYLAFTVD